MKDIVTISHGTGGKNTKDFISQIFMSEFKNEFLSQLEDSTVVKGLDGDYTFTIDGHTISPIFFKGGDIGKLSITGTINDLVVRGSIPLYIMVSFIIEEGFPVEDLKKIVSSMREEAERNGVFIITGDTKVLPSKSLDGIFIITAGVGKVIADLSMKNIEDGDVVIASGTLGDHEALIFSLRNNIKIEGLQSDCASILPIAKSLFDENLSLKAMRDPTRGGLSGVLNEWAEDTGFCFEIYEERIPIKKEVKALSDLLGIEPYSFASEGRFLLVVSEEDSDRALDIVRKYSKEAEIIGKVSKKYPKKVILITELGTQRILHPPTTEILPRIC